MRVGEGGKILRAGRRGGGNVGWGGGGWRRVAVGGFLSGGLVMARGYGAGVERRVMIVLWD